MLVEVNKNKILNLLPLSELNQNVHIQIHTTKGVGEICEDCKDLKNAQTLRAYLTYCKEHQEYSLVHDSEIAHVTVLLAKFSARALDTKMKICATSSKQFKLAGIDVFWRIERDRVFEFSFYVNTSKINRNIDESIKEMHQNQVAPTLNAFFAKRKSYFPKPSDAFGKHSFQPFHEQVEKWTRKWEVSKNFEVREEDLNCQLMEYQKTTVKWMIEKELNSEKIDLSNILRSKQLVTPSLSNNGKSLYYHPILGIFTESNAFDSISPPRGGILADEMGLGKTVEVLALILSNQKDGQVSKTSKGPSTRKFLDWEEYEMAKNAGESKRSAAVYTVKPNQIKNKKAGKCEKCGDLCDLEKCGWKEEFEKENVAFWCPRCMPNQTPLEVKTTLIVLPEPLMLQWYNEIVKHCSEELKVMFYFGMNRNGYLHPLEIAKFDIILTSYNTLATEFGFTGSKNKTNKPSTTSLTHVKWWRLICDEAQLIEDSSDCAALMCTKIQSHHRWCITSTPILNSVADLGGLFRLIGLWPLNVEHFWEKYVVAEFLEMSKKKKNLLKSVLFQIAAQFMRRNTKKMVEDELQLPKLIEIEKNVKFSEIEESLYIKEMEDLKEQVEHAIEEVPNKALVNFMAGKQKALSALKQLKETLISCGEHSDLCKSQNVKTKVMSDSKNVIFQLISTKKRLIDEKLRVIFLVVSHIAELNWLKNNMMETMNRYYQIADIYLMIKDVNERCEKVMSTGDEEMEVNNSSKNENIRTLSRKRAIEGTSAEVAKVPRKIAHLEVEQDEDEEKDEVRLEAEQKAEATVLEMRKSAMKPILFDCLPFVRFSASIKEMENFPVIKDKVETLKDRMGGPDNILQTLVDQYSIVERNKVIATKVKQVKIFEEWKENEDQHVGMKKILEKMKKSYRSSELVEKLIASNKMATLLREMSFWPVFANSVQHFEDGALEQSAKLGNPLQRFTHNRNCMGVCNKKSVEVISRGYKLSKSSQLLQKLIVFIDELETMREEIFSGYSSLIDTFVTKSFCDHASDTLLCSHMPNVYEQVCISEETRKNENEKIKCQICSVLHTLVNLSFAIGIGNYHGRVKYGGTRETMESFFSLVFTIEAKRNAKFDGTQQLSDFRNYLARLRATSLQIRFSFCELIKYSNLMKRINNSKQRMTMDRLRNIKTDVKTKDWPDNKLIEYHIGRYELNFNRNIKIVNSSCQELRYLMTQYEKKQSDALNGREEEEDDYENCCPICGLEQEIVANYPCGHTSCERCYRELRIRISCDDSLRCVTCRRMFIPSDVIVERRNVTPGMKLSVKLEATIRLMEEIIEEDPVKNKILLFTTMKFGTPIWKFLTKVLQKEELLFIEVTRNNSGENISHFKLSTECKILLWSLPMCENGLNLTEASHIIFLDPSHSFKEVEKAIGRISRVGQKRDIKVYHMITEGSIDEKIRKIEKAGEKKKEDTDLTVANLCQIFEII